MSYIIVLTLMAMTGLFAILSYILKNKVVVIATAFLFLITGIFILGYGIEIPIGTVTTLVR
jgi:hypothetical protein